MGLIKSRPALIQLPPHMLLAHACLPEGKQFEPRSPWLRIRPGLEAKPSPENTDDKVALSLLRVKHADGVVVEQEGLG